MLLKAVRAERGGLCHGSSVTEEASSERRLQCFLMKERDAAPVIRVAASWSKTSGGAETTAGRGEEGELRSGEEGGQFLLPVSSHQSQIHTDPRVNSLISLNGGGAAALRVSVCVEHRPSRFWQRTKASFVFPTKKKKFGGLRHSLLHRHVKV